MDPTTEFGEFHDQVTSNLVQTTRTTGQLASEDLNFCRSSNREFSEALDEQSGRIISLTSSLLKAASRSDVAAPDLQDEESIDDNWRGVVEVIDALLEKADACLDEFTGVIKRLSPSQQEQQQKQQARLGRKANLPKFPTIFDYGPSKIPKPQLEFPRPVDNTDGSHFRPLLRSKPHAIVPLEKSLETVDSSGGYKNPYETEINQAKYPRSTKVISPPIPFLPFDPSTATLVDTLEGVKEMLAELKTAKEIAIDVEHHNVHSYQGIVCLIQISTREKDWVIDTLKPWREELQILNEVFADPKILKVLHGASMDIIWLQRDLGLYIVGMFDTFFAASALNYQKRSLKFLLEKFADFEAEKAYQVADWRVRPLPKGMFDYARSDTHFLLYVYDHLRNELLENSSAGANLVDYVHDQSKKMAIQSYDRPKYNAQTGQGYGGWFEYLMRNGSAMSKEQLAVFRAVHQWRDGVARAEDESPQCVFPKHVLFKLANVMPLDMGVLLKTLSPMNPSVRNRAADLLRVIKKAKIDGANGPEWHEVIKAIRPQLVEKTADNKLVDVNYANVERSLVSQFWGDLLDYREPIPPLEKSIVASQEALHLCFPLPPIPATVSEVREKLAPSQPAPSAQPPSSLAQPPQQKTPPTEEPNKTDNNNEIFTIKSLSSRKRKLNTADESDEEQAQSGEPDDDGENITLDDPADEQRIERKRAKKQAKREKKKIQQLALQKEKEKAAQEETPLDYNKAESMLKPTLSEQQKGVTTSTRTFNPYAKAMDAPKGLPKNKVEPSAAKTFTFR